MKTFPRIILILLLAGAFCWCYSQQDLTGNSLIEYKQAAKLYAEADALSAAADNDPAKEAQQEARNQRALAGFLHIISEKNTPDSILFHCYVKTGLLYHGFDSLPKAAQYYQKALALRPRLRDMADSFFFKPTLFAGSICYSNNLYDSALQYYHVAEAIANEYNRPLEESERLYNRMGAMYYEAGNYRLAGNYFEKALSLLSPANPAYRDLLINFKINIASIAVKLEEYQKAEALYRDILPFGLHLDEINHNLGIISLNTGRYREAVSFFHKTKYDDSPAMIELCYNMAAAFSRLHQKDSVAYYVQQATVINTRINGSRKNAAMGLLDKFSGDEKMQAGNYAEALSLYTAAVCQSYPAYNNPDPYAEPEKFTGVLSFAQLFNSLIAKGEVFTELRKTAGGQKDLEAAFKAYRAAFDLADHVAKTYDSDEARLFLTKIKYAVHDKAIQSSLALYDLTKDKYYLGEAYLFDQQNKASALTLALQENTQFRLAGKKGEQESALRSLITRQLLKAAHTADSTAVQKLNDDIRDNEIKLSQLHEEISNDPLFARLQPAAAIPSAEKLQAMLDNKTALLSYHLSEHELLVFYFRDHNFGCIKQSVDSNFFNDIRSFVAALHLQDESQRYSGRKPAAALYDKLIRPLLSEIGGCKRLVIIPDDELNYVPFEALQDEQNNYLLHSYSIQYQFSTALLQLNEPKNADDDVLAFAPFTADNPNTSLAVLSYSKEEVSSLRGMILTDSEATKQNFERLAKKYSTVQLATHAAANDSVPEQSFIAFYPAATDSAGENHLSAAEIYGLKLDSINLVILSACETGNGQLVRGEGLMSITRAFSYAGCPNIITSLWKASDKTTAFLTRRLHVYLDKGYSKDRALQQAKIDLLNSNEIPPALKTPNYWAHLVFIGNYHPAKRSFLWYWIGAAILIAAGGIFIFRKRVAGV